MERVKNDAGLPTTEKPEESISGTEPIDTSRPPVDNVDPVASGKLTRKMDLHLFPLLAGLYVMSFLDRTNIGNARLYGLEADLGMHGSDYQLAVSILFVTYITFEVPGSIFLKKLTPRLFISVSAFIWGVLSMCTGFCTSLGSLIGLRLLLGIAEAAYFPAVVFYLTLFYRRRELAFRLFYMFAASALSGSIGGLLAYGIGFMDGVQGYRAWRWVFILEGLPTIALAVLAGIFLPNDTQSARFLSEEEKALALRRFAADQADLGPAEKAGKVDWDQVKAAFRDWKVWSMSFCQMGNTAMLYTYSTFLPTIIRGLGYTSYQTQLLTIPCYFCGALCFCVTGYLSDKLGWRGPFAVLGHFVSCLGYAIVLACGKTNAGPGAQYAGCVIIAMGLYTAVGLPLSWNVTNLPSTYKRATANGFMFAMANSSGVWSPFVYKTTDAPGYILGHSVILAVVFLGGTGYAIISYKLHRENIFRDKGGRDYLLTERTPEEIARLGDHHPSYRYVP